MLTSDEYVKKGGLACPVCESPDIDGDTVELDSGIAWQWCTCDDCGAAWMDQYKLVGYDELETG